MGEASVEVISTPNIVPNLSYLASSSGYNDGNPDSYLCCPLKEILGSNILPLCRGDNYKFHAAGREDIDVMEICFSVAV